MEFKFPEPLFPSFYNYGPPDTVRGHSAGKWGSYDRLLLQGDSGSQSNWTFTSRHEVRGETWRHIEPVPRPLLSPKNEFLWPIKPPNPLDFTEHMGNFFMDYSQDAFGCMSRILGENFNFDDGVKKRNSRDSVHMWKMTNFLNGLKFKRCQVTYSSRTVNSYNELLWDVVHSIPPELLGSLLYEELTEQRERLLFSEGATGGALDFIPFSHNGSGFLIYPGKQGLNQLKFQRVELQHHRGRSSVLTCSTSDLFSFPLKGPIRQISSASMFNNCCVAVRSDYLCGVWRFIRGDEPRLLQVVNTREVATCISASPHVLGEVLVASESGVVNLWNVGRGTQRVRQEDANMYFNAKSSWRWCDFSAHPRVVLYADRTGVELTDMRVSPVSGLTLFHISSSSECQHGERLMLSKYLGDVHPFHHLVTTQFSAYLVDERFPGVPMLKWDHMMESPPMFCRVLPGSAPCGSAVGGAGTTKVVLGSQSSQEITLLQYSGGGATACSSRGPPQALLRPRNSLKHLPVQIPHRLDIATNRLSSPAAGLTCVQKKRREDGGEDEDECLCVLQLTEAGDVFYQILEPQLQQLHRDTCPPTAADVKPPPRQKASQPAASSSSVMAASSVQLVVEDSASDDDAIGPTQFQTVPTFVAETPEKEQETFFDSDESEEEQRRRKLRQLKLQVVVNDGPGSDDDEDKTDAGEKDGGKADTVKEPVCSSTSVSDPCEETTEVRISEDTLVTWRHWLQRLMKKSREKKPRPRCSRLLTVNTEGLLRLPSRKAQDSSEDERVQSLRRDLRTCMSKRSLLLHSNVTSSSSLADPSAPLPDTVDTSAWRDPLSQRLTVSWQGEDKWRAWWDEELGLNKAEKVKALRRKRKREKEKRAASRVELSGSFTTTSNYQSELDSLSDSAGWMSGSRGGWSDSEGEGTLSQMPPTVVSDTPVATPTTSPQKRVKGNCVEPQAPSRSCDVSVSLSEKTNAATYSLRTRKCPAEGDHSTLSTSQGESSLSRVDVVDSSIRSPQSVVQRKVGVDVSTTDSAVWSGFFHSRSLSQSSRGRLGLSQLSQSSQAKKKKPQMGF